MSIIQTRTLNDNEKFKLIIMECLKLMQERNTKYGDSWKTLTIPSMANLIEMKMHRVANMHTQKLDPKMKDEFMDSINYACFALIKLQNL